MLPVWFGLVKVTLLREVWHFLIKLAKHLDEDALKKEDLHIKSPLLFLMLAA